MFWTETLASDPFSSTLMNGFDLTIDFEETFIQNPTNQKKLLYCLWNLREWHSLWNLHDGLGLLMVSNSSVKHVAWGMFSSS